MLGYGEAVYIKESYTDDAVFCRSHWHCTFPVANNIAAVDPGAGGGLLVDVFDMPAVPSIGGGGIPSVTPGAEENLKK